MKRALVGRLVLALIVVAALAAFFLFNLGDWLTLEMLKARRGELAALLGVRPFAFMAAYFILYVTFAALSIPGAAGINTWPVPKCCSSSRTRMGFSARWPPTQMFETFHRSRNCSAA